jgi:hypothetical protein
MHSKNLTERIKFFSSIAFIMKRIKNNVSYSKLFVWLGLWPEVKSSLSLSKRVNSDIIIIIQGICEPEYINKNEHYNDGNLDLCFGNFLRPCLRLADLA